MRILITCAHCKIPFDILAAEWCKHKQSTKVCPFCKKCACDKKEELIAIKLSPPIQDIEIIYVGNTDVWVEGDPTVHPRREQYLQEGSRLR